MPLVMPGYFFCTTFMRLVPEDITAFTYQGKQYLELLFTVIGTSYIGLFSNLDLPRPNKYVLDHA